MKVKMTPELEKLVKSRGGEAYILHCLQYVIGNVEMPSLYEYNYVCGMKVSVYDLGTLWKTGYSPYDRLFGIKPDDQ